VEVRLCRASAVVVQRVPAAVADWFLEWQRGIHAVAGSFAGFRGTDVYPPSDGQREEWVVVFHFDDERSLQRWLDSPTRAEWVEKLRGKIGDFKLQVMPGGFGPWFAGLAPSPEAAPSSWKMVLMVLLGLYPTVMLLTIVVGPWTSPLGLAVSMLIGNALSVSILQWGVMPALTTLFGPWLKAHSGRKKLLSIGGLCLILLLLAGLAILFRQVTG